MLTGHFSDRLTAAVIKCRVVILIATLKIYGIVFSGRLTAAVIKCRVVILMATLIIYGIVFSGRLTAAVLKYWEFANDKYANQYRVVR